MAKEMSWLCRNSRTALLLAAALLIALPGPGLLAQESGGTDATPDTAAEDGAPQAAPPEGDAAEVVPPQVNPPAAVAPRPAVRAGRCHDQQQDPF
ncbi:hypothetical protein QW131_20060 [Roseibium salinum]|nr:hypothetical protein [Roseibium salinum]